MGARQFIVPASERGSRLDKWLTRRMPEFSRGQIKYLLNCGEVLVNHRRVFIAGWELKPNDAVEVRLPAGPKFLKEKGAQKRGAPLNIIYEDKDIIVINKPSGVLTEPKSDSPHGHLLGMIRGHLKKRYREAGGTYVKLVHRLDKDTTGLIVAAKSKVGERLEDQFRDHKIERSYLAIVEGAVEQERGKIDFPIEKGSFEGGKKVRIAEGEGKQALTFYEVKERYPAATLLEVRVATGRTHQVRLHLAKIGHPLVGDAIYGAGQISFKRHALHANRLAFSHPRSGKKMRFELKPPLDMQGLLDELRERV